MEEGVMEEENAEVDEEGEGGWVEEEEEDGEGSNKDEAPAASAKVVGGLKVKSCLPLLLQGE